MVHTDWRKIMSFKKTRMEGVFHNAKTGKYMARKTILGKQHKQTFENEAHARVWRSTFDGEKSEVKVLTSSSLRHVWSVMQEKHFPILAGSTREIWLRRYNLFKDLEEFRMEEITPSKITSWVEEKVKHFKSSDYQESGRGKAKRCNLDNELNLFTTIFNWYKDSEEFEAEAINLTNPVKTRHKKSGFIQVKPIKDKAITLEAALQFFECLKPLYRDLALFQFYSASRIGEAAGLQWSRIDLENRKITIMETCRWDMTTKQFLELNKFPKNKEPRPLFLTDEIMEVLKRRKAFKTEGNDFVFHVEGAPLNYSTIQLNFREGQRISRIPYTGTHILRHGMAKLARSVGGGLDAVVAMTGHKDFKLANHYSKLDGEYQKEISKKIMEYVKASRMGESSFDNVVKIGSFRKAKE
jgi:integrase